MERRDPIDFEGPLATRYTKTPIFAPVAAMGQHFKRDVVLERLAPVLAIVLRAAKDCAPPAYDVKDCAVR